MDASEYKKAKQLFEVVSALPKAAQSGHLQAMTTDAVVVAYVEKLLRQTDTDHPRVAKAVLRGFNELNNPSASAAENINLGDKLGVWSLVKKIGQGGMGAVYLAQRVDGHFEQTAAVKVLYGAPSAKALEHLSRERQILATLTHPNIARLYDGGATAAGQPYLVMEYVDGVNIDAFVGESKLAQVGILNLVIAVCEAVSFAHQRLIVHCDIKPSNILVNAAGRPTLLDFGIARLLGSGLELPVSAHSAQHAGKLSESSEASGAFTPRYASPEQRDGGALTTATDVYSLGKLLLELLANYGKSAEKPVEQSLQTAQTGQMGLRAESTKITNWLKPKSSAVTSVDQIADVELRAIISHATANDVTKRYPTVAALAADILRYQKNLPIQALPRSAMYVAQKFGRRNWPWLVAASVATCGAGYAAQQVVTERNLAQAAQRVAVAQRDATALAQAATLLERDGARAARTQALQERDRAAQAEALAAQQRNQASAAATVAVQERNRAVQAESAANQTAKFLVSVFSQSEANAKTGDVTASVLLDRAEKQLEVEMQGQPQVQAKLYSTLGTVQRGMGAYLKSEKLHARAVELEKQNQLGVSAEKGRSALALATSGASVAASSEQKVSKIGRAHV